MSNPVFVLGNPRSGTSLLRLMLTSHPELVIPPEAGFMCWFHSKYSALSAVEWLEPSTIACFAADVFSSKKFTTWNLSESELLASLRSCRPENYAEACECVYLAFLKKFKPSAKRWGDKNNFHCAQVDVLRFLFPSAQLLHIVRDPRDVVCSYREVMRLKSCSPFKPHLPVDCREIAEEWVQNIEFVERATRNTSDDNYHFIRYEELTARPEQTMRNLCSWLGVSFDPHMLSFYELNRKNTLEPKQTLDWKIRTLEPISEQSVGRYVRELKDADIGAIEEIAGAKMQAWGYSVASTLSDRRLKQI